ncbi:MAG: trimeric intracellular cation channel family protein [Spirochaetes bacterium]|uniref:Trimeric intracellular cation channel family protein n=1 Tax=Candidatus Ornithospirochaeta stercoripullorum TaxID=2840899 RepID=A0A9D9H4D1_9SPIO|nr:trimeric intracellular cation channel family protein [Candidatus Ornithospirochaeta stercoripullorum]
MDSGIVYAFDIFGTAIFAITGAVKGVRNRLDFLGVIVFAITVGCGGGMLRDTILGIFPIAVFRDNAYILICIAMGIAVFLLSPKTVGRWAIIQYLDAVGLGVFTAIGCVKAEALGLGGIGVVASGVFGAVGGGVLRDVFCHEIPMVLTSDFYASASILGGILFMILFKSGVGGDVLMYSTAIFTMVLRMLGYHFRWKLPVARMVGEEKRDR